MPLIKKELKEHAKWVPVGLFIMLVLAWAATPKSLSDFGWSSGRLQLISSLGFASAIFAVFLGVVQTVWDFSDRNRGYLLHRAVSLNAVLISKVVSGAIMYFAVTLVPLSLVATYFAAKGIEQLPVRPLQVVPSLLVICLCYFFHPATIWMVIRPAKWYGTKLLPLSVPAFICFAYANAVDNSWVSWMFFVICLLIVFGVAASMIAKSLRAAVLVTASCICVAGAIVFFVMIAESLQNTIVASSLYERAGNQFGSDSEGDLWLYSYRSVYDEKIGQNRVKYISGSKLESKGIATTQGKLPDGFKANWVASEIHQASSPKRYGAMDNFDATATKLYIWDERGYILVYSRSQPSGLIGIISREGFTKGSVPVGRPFAEKPNRIGLSYGAMQTFTSPSGGIVTRYHILWADREGVYSLDASTNKLEIVVDQPVRSTHAIHHEEIPTSEFLVQTDSQLLRYRSNISDASQENPFSLELVDSYPRLPESELRNWWIAAGDNGQLVAIDSTMSGNARLAKIASAEETQWDISEVSIKHDNERNSLQEVAFGLIPPVIAAAFNGLLVIIQLATMRGFNTTSLKSILHYRTS